MALFVLYLIDSIGGSCVDLGPALVDGSAATSLESFLDKTPYAFLVGKAFSSFSFCYL